MNLPRLSYLKASEIGWNFSLSPTNNERREKQILLSEVIATAWEMDSARQTQDRQCKTCLDLLKEAHEGECICNTNQEWYNCALQLLSNSNIPVDNCASCVKNLLNKGRRKFRNILLTGPRLF